MSSQKKIRVGILFGGKSEEHEVSLQSAKNIVEAIDKEKYDVVLIGIDKSGSWLMPGGSQFLLNESDPKLIKLNKQNEQSVAFAPHSEGKLVNLTNRSDHTEIDVVFPVLHGPFGEDGTVQGLLKLAGIPFVGADVLGSAIGMDKDVTKRLLRDAGMPIGKFLTFFKEDKINMEKIADSLGFPLFIKPANLGSSVGVSKAYDIPQSTAAISKAFKHDTKILIEEFIEGRELECAVLGNQHPEASGVGEIIPNHDFYSYEAKYIDQNGAGISIPADIEKVTEERIRELSVKTFKVLSCAGLARVDFFLKKDGRLFVNEINTIPGFTNISMYPQLWAARGIGYSDLIDRLLMLAIERFECERH